MLPLNINVCPADFQSVLVVDGLIYSEKTLAVIHIHFPVSGKEGTTVDSKSGWHPISLSKF